MLGKKHHKHTVFLLNGGCFYGDIDHGIESAQKSPKKKANEKYIYIYIYIHKRRDR